MIIAGTNLLLDECGVAQSLDDEAVFLEQRLHVIADGFVIVDNQNAYEGDFDRQGALLERSGWLVAVTL